MLYAKIKKKVLRNEFTRLDCDIYCSWLRDPSRNDQYFQQNRLIHNFVRGKSL